MNTDKASTKKSLKTSHTSARDSGLTAMKNFLPGRYFVLEVGKIADLRIAYAGCHMKQLSLLLHMNSLGKVKFMLRRVIPVVLATEKRIPN